MFVFAVILVLLLVCDFIWFQFSLETVYKPVLGDFTVRYAGTIAWALLAIGINTFAVSTAKDEKEAALKGALFGLVVYGVYNGTNYATIPTWTSKIWLLDNLWGVFVCALVSYISFLIFKKK